METFILVMFIMFILEIGIKLKNLNGIYPRIENHRRAVDAISMIIHIVIAVWAGTLIF